MAAERATLAETHLAAVIHAGGGFCRSNPDLILWADPEVNAEGKIVFVDNSAIAWDMDSAWAVLDHHPPVVVSYAEPDVTDAVVPYVEAAFATEPTTVAVAENTYPSLKRLADDWLAEPARRPSMVVLIKRDHRPLTAAAARSVTSQNMRIVVVEGRTLAGIERRRDAGLPADHGPTIAGVRNGAAD